MANHRHRIACDGSTYDFHNSDMVVVFLSFEVVSPAHIVVELLLFDNATPAKKCIVHLCYYLRGIATLYLNGFARDWSCNEYVVHCVVYMYYKYLYL